MKYVFVVGLPRTGTKLVKNVLQSSPFVCCRISNEIWYFGDLFRPGIRRILRKFGDLSDDDNVRKLVDYMYSGQFERTYWKALAKGRLAGQSWMEQRILESARSEQELYNIMMEGTIAVADDNCRAKDWVLGDKTPGHLYHIPKLLKWFPDAKILHTFRDPRAIMASEWKRLAAEKSNGLLGNLTSAVRTLTVVLYVTITWLYAVKLHNRYMEKYPENYYLSKYENLVSMPEENVHKICDYIGIQYSEEMLKPAMQGSSFRTGKDSGFEYAAIDRWRSHLKPWMKSWITLVTRKQLKNFGYKL